MFVAAEGEDNCCMSAVAAAFGGEAEVNGGGVDNKLFAVAARAACC